MTSTAHDPRTALVTYLAAPDAATLSVAVVAAEQLMADGLSLITMLDEAAAFPDAEPGRAQIAAPIGFNQHRLVAVRTPEGYDSARRWPLIVLYHSWGGTADRMLDRLEGLLGDEIEQFVVAAPEQYRQTILDAPPPVSSEHVAVWREVMRERHIDPDRVFVVGYSLGGETAMTTTALHGHRLAAAIGWANTPAFPPDVEGMWEWFAPNFSTTPVLHVWGSNDLTNIPGLNGRRSDTRLAEINRLFAPIAEAAGIAYSPIEVPDAGHDDVLPPLDATLEMLTLRRGSPPTSVSHRFRYIHQADTAWVEGHEWKGAGWLTPWPSPEVESGAASPEEEAAQIQSLLGSIVGDLEANTIRLTTTHLADLTIWLLDDLIEFSEPVTVVHNGTEVFSGMVEPDLAVALSQAVRTADFERLRWGGIRIVDGIAHVVTSDDEFPDLARGITFG